jgi:hypothetical protein
MTWFKVLFSPLILNLLQAFQEKKAYQKYCKRVFNINYMIKACLKKNHFDLVLTTLDISADYAGEALEYASQSGHIPVVELLLKCRTDIIANSGAGWALIFASEKGQTSILQRRTDIPDFLLARLFGGNQMRSHFHCQTSFQNRTDIFVLAFMGFRNGEY